MTSPGFPDFKRTCEIGPVIIKTEKTTVKTTVIQPKIEVVPPKIHNQKTLTSNGCARECPDDKYTILYLTMATVGAVMLTMVFLITISLCVSNIIMHPTILEMSRETSRAVTVVNLCMSHYSGARNLKETHCTVLLKEDHYTRNQNEF